MELMEFTNNLNRKWQKRICRTCRNAIIIIISVEMIIFISYLFMGVIEGTVVSHFCLRVLLPSCINIISYLITKKAIDNEKIPVEQRNYVVCANILIICTVLAVIHNYYFIMWMTPSVALFYSTLFNNYKVLNLTFLGTIISTVLSTIVNIMEAQFHRATTITYSFITIVLFGIAYFISKSIIKHHIIQLEYTYKELEKQQALIEELDIEPLTKLYNKKALFRDIREIVEKSKNENASESIQWVAIFDLDHFKSVNDTYGHLNGDKVLMRMARLLETFADGQGKVYRYGGEEFVVLFEPSSEEEIMMVCENIRRQMERERFEFDWGRVITVSAGAAPFSAKRNYEEWIKHADTALYHAKETGRNRVEIIRRGNTK
ncbi:MAG: GGDEF domain-containing protein [Lachnospiraceae bacterium]|nr:GGDEF domain-containing protein [Lachnospiraceae bacterium]